MSPAVATAFRGKTSGERDIQRAFTLTEMLVVIAVISILLTLIVPAVGTLLRGTQMNRAADDLINQLTLARQTAIAGNYAVEVRLYQYALAGNPGEQVGSPATGRYRALQILSVTDAGTVAPIGKVEILPSQIIMDSNAQLSTLLATAQNNPTLSIPAVGTNYNWCSFRFRPDGSTNLSPVTPAYWCVTLHNALEGDNRTTPPSNYATLQIDPVNGSLTMHRP